MEKNPEFDDIRPYYEDEMASVTGRLLKDAQFQKVIKRVLPNVEWAEFEKAMLALKSRREFQHDLVIDFVLKITDRTAKLVNASGLENISNKEAYTYISNHRDIILDASILCTLLANNGFETTEIAIGDNLLLYPWIEDLVRLNKSFIVKRGVSIRQMLEVSKHLSQYIHYTIRDKKQSVWIAQREGRAKNSNDRTQESLLKMLALGGDKSILENIEKLNIAPVALSYEYDPCDYLKAQEFQKKRDNPDFKKSHQDDLDNMEIGMLGYKGNIHFQFGRPINPALRQIDPTLNKVELLNEVVSLIDTEIFLNYQFYPINYIAYDKLWGNGFFKEKYSAEDVRTVNDYLQKQLDKIHLPDKDLPFLTEKLLEMYAYPVKNQLSVKNNEVNKT
jgi:hypothetical protein